MRCKACDCLLRVDQSDDEMCNKCILVSKQVYISPKDSKEPQHVLITSRSVRSNGVTPIRGGKE